VSGESVLVIDDEEPVRRFLRVALGGQSYRVIEAATGKDGITFVAVRKPDVIILDLGLPDLDGVEVTRRLRQMTQTPVIILSARGSENDKIAALEAGADDYLIKPFGIGELLARLRAALRRATQPPDEAMFTSGALMVDGLKRLVTVDGKEVQLTPHEYGILKTLVTYAGKVITHHHLLKEVWGPGFENEYHFLHVNVSNLRRKIERDPTRPIHLITEPGVGYRLKGE
jgi:two-component system, OmpR family, KDP operon response regulator KdpE